MITLKFTDKDVEHKNPKAARAWLRKNGMNVRQATKNGSIWVFDFALGNKVSHKAHANIPVQSAETGRMPFLKLSNEIMNIGAMSDDRTIHNTPVNGKDLLPGDLIINFAEFYDLTVDYRGVHEIVIEAPNVTRVENRFFGFYSEESGSLLSYRIEPDTTYDVVR